MLDLVFQEIVDGLATINNVQTASGPPKRRDQMTVPAIIVDLAELEPDINPGTDELALISHWEARIVVSDGQPEAVAWAIVRLVMQWLFDYDWPILNVGRVTFKQAAPDHFSPEYQGHRVWLVEWTQPIRTGPSVWDVEGVIPDTILVGEQGDPAEPLGI